MTVRNALLAATAAAAFTIGAPGGADAQNRQQIRIVGSSTVFPFATTVAERFAQTASFPAPIVESTGSGGGIKLFCEGVGTNTPDIANASRRIKQSEVEQCARNGVDRITEVKIGFDGIVLASAREAEPLQVTIPQLYQALARQVPQNGKLVDNPYKTWSDIDTSLPNTPIQVFGPPPTSGTRDAFVELVMEVGCEEFDAVKNLPKDQQKAACQQIREDGAFIEAGENDNLIVQRLQADPNTYGIFGYSFLDQNQDRIQGNPIGGTKPTYETIASGDYPVSRSLYFYLKNAHVGVVPGLKEYVAEFTSPTAWGDEGYLADKGLIALPEDQRERQREQAMGLEPLEASDLAEG